MAPNQVYLRQKFLGILRDLAVNSSLSPCSNPEALRQLIPSKKRDHKVQRKLISLGIKKFISTLSILMQLTKISSCMTWIHPSLSDHILAIFKARVSRKGFISKPYLNHQLIVYYRTFTKIEKSKLLK